MSKPLIGTNEFTSEEWDKIPFPARQQLGDHGQLRDARGGNGITEFTGKSPQELVHAEPMNHEDAVQKVTYHLESTPPPSEPAGAPGSESYNRNVRATPGAEEAPGTHTTLAGATAVVHNENHPATTQRNTGENSNSRIMDMVANADTAQTSSETGAASGAENVASDESKASSGSDEVPEGSVAQVLAWVGDDSDRARRALEAEQERPTPRQTLVAQLNERI